MTCPGVDVRGVDSLFYSQISRGVPRYRCKGSVEAYPGVNVGGRRAEAFPGDGVAGVDNLL